MSLMLLLAAAIIAFTSNLDNLGFGLAYGMRSIHISLVPNSIIASLTMLATGLSMYLGSKFTYVIPTYIVNVSAGIAIMGVGVFTVLGMEWIPNFRVAFTRKMTPHLPGPGNLGWLCMNSRNCRVISPREAIVVGVALSCNNVVTGVASGASGIPIGVTTVLAGVFSLVCVGGGSQLGLVAGARVFGKAAPLVAGVLLIAIGLWIAIA